MNRMDWKQAIAIGLILGLMAAGVVWYLERFQMQQMHIRFEDMLKSHDDFQAWLKDQGKDIGID